MRVGSRIAGTMAVAAALVFGAPVVGSTRAPMPVPRQIVDADEKNVRRRLKRPRAEILRRALTWRGVGLFSKGPRFPKTQAAQPTNALSRTADQQLYMQYRDGSFRRVPRKNRDLSGRQRKLLRRWRFRLHKTQLANLPTSHV